MMFTTAYLTLFLTCISNISLMREFLRYIASGKVDGRSVLNLLTINISSNNSKVSKLSVKRIWVSPVPRPLQILSHSCRDLSQL